MNLRQSFTRPAFTRPAHIPVKLFLLLAGLIILTISFSHTGIASAGSALNRDVNPLGHPDSGAPQVAAEQDATLAGLNATADGSPLALTPSFDPDVTLYRATADAEEVAVSANATRAASSIDQFAVGTETTSVENPSNLLSTTVALTEGAITNFSLRVLAEDGVTTRTYHIGFSRPADPSVPDITIAADHTEYVAGLGALTYTLTREGDTADSLDVTVNFTQTQNWLSDTARTATFAAGDDETLLPIPASEFSSSITQSGDLAATVAALDGYDTSGASVQIRVISQEGPAITVTIEHPAYSVAEDAGTLNIRLVAVPHSSVTSVSPFRVGVMSNGQTASSGSESPDYEVVTVMPQFTSSDFEDVEGTLVGRKTVSVTILDDDVYEGDEQFHLHLGRAAGSTSEIATLDAEGNLCGDLCTNPYVVTITDNDGPAVTVQFGQNAYTVLEGSSQDVIVTLSEDPERTVVIPITTTDQDGATDADYSGVPQTVTFNSGETSKTIPFAATFDAEDDDGESVKLSFGSMLPAGVAEGDINETTVSITNLVPEITIAADHTEYVAGLGRLTYTLTREGDTAASLDVTVNFTQTRNWLSDTARTATFAAGDDETLLIIQPSDFSSRVTQSGDLTATVAARDGYDTSGASVQIRVISQEGPAITVTIEHPAYSVAEDAGTLDIGVLARYHSGVSQASPVTVTLSVSAAADTAVSTEGVADYQALSEIVRFQTSDFEDVEGTLVGRKTVSVTINEDGVYEGDEQFHLHLGQTPGLSSEVKLLDTEGESCGSDCPNPYVVTITDNDGPAVTVQFRENAYTVLEGRSQDVIVTLSEDPERTVVVSITTTDQDGATGADFSGVPPTVTFNAGEISKTIPFAATRDTEDDDGESVKLSFGSMLPPGVAEGNINETTVSIIHLDLIASKDRPGISVPMCKHNGMFIYWHGSAKFEDDPTPYGWRIERRHFNDGAWTTTRHDFLGADAVALQTYSDEFWDWTDTTRRLGVDYTYRVHALDNDGNLMEGRNWSRRARALCP